MEADSHADTLALDLHAQWSGLEAITRTLTLTLALIPTLTPTLTLTLTLTLTPTLTQARLRG